MNKTGSISGHFQKRTQIQLFQLGRITIKLPDLINLGDFGRRAVSLHFWSDITILLVYFSKVIVTQYFTKWPLFEPVLFIVRCDLCWF